VAASVVAVNGEHRSQKHGCLGSGCLATEEKIKLLEKLKAAAVKQRGIYFTPRCLKKKLIMLISGCGCRPRAGAIATVCIPT